MSKIDDKFRQLKKSGKKAFIPFVTAGDPDLEFTASVAAEFAKRGASFCEIGIPYSDPIADGPTIQASYTRALANRTSLQDIFSQLERIACSEMPLVTMVSYAIVLRQGLPQFVARAKSAGVAGAIVPDLLVEEAEPLASICRQEDFSLIQLVTPTTPRERALRIAAASSGFLYYVSVTGITGERRELPPELIDNVTWLREQSDLPVCIGFGISQPQHVRQLRDVADGVIVGSALVKHLGRAKAANRQQVLSDIGQLAADLAAALNGPQP